MTSQFKPVPLPGGHAFAGMEALSNLRIIETRAMTPAERRKALDAMREHLKPPWERDGTFTPHAHLPWVSIQIEGLPIDEPGKKTVQARTGKGGLTLIFGLYEVEGAFHFVSDSDDLYALVNAAQKEKLSETQS